MMRSLAQRLVLLAAALSLGLGGGASLAAAASRRSLTYGIPQDRLESFAFETELRLEMEPVQMPAEAESFAVQPVLERLGSTTTAVGGRLERMVARVFRDGSLGLVTRVTDLQGTIVRDDAAPEPIQLKRLEGKSLSLRIKPSGEILDSHGWSHIEGANRGGAALTELWLLQVLRLPIRIPETETGVPSTWRLRIPVDERLERDQNWSLRFVREEPPEGCGPSCLALSYSGTITEDSRDTHPARPMSLQGTAEVEGQIVLRGARRHLASHRWSIQSERSVRSHRANGTVRGELRQRLITNGRLWREGK